MTPVKKTVIPAVSVAAIFLISACLLVYMRTSPRFEITHIGIRGNSRLTPEAIVTHLNIQPQTNIFQIQLDEIQQRLESLQWVKTAHVYRNFPNKISVDLTERRPFVLVKFDQLHIVDKEGVVLGALASGSAITLPIITGKLVEQIDLEGENPTLQQALQAIHELMNSSPPVFQQIRKIHIQSLDNASFMSHDPALPDIRISLVEYHQNVQRLQQIYPTLSLENLASIDLRFERRIIVK